MAPTAAPPRLPHRFAPADLSVRPYRCPRDETCSADRHDSNRGYSRGCRSQLATLGRRRRYLDELAGVSGRLVDSTGTTRKLQALVVLGYTASEIAEALYWAPQYVSRLSVGQYPRLQAATAARVDEQWVLLSETDPAPTRYRTRSRRAAIRRGWQPVEAWDRVDIDDPTARAWGGRPASTHRIANLADRNARTVARAADIRALVVEATLAGGTEGTLEAIARRTGVSTRAVSRHRLRARELGELPPVDRRDGLSDDSEAAA